MVQELGQARSAAQRGRIIHRFDTGTLLPCENSKVRSKVVRKPLSPLTLRNSAQEPPTCISIPRKELSRPRKESALNRHIGLIAIGLLALLPGCFTFSAQPMRPNWTASSHIQQQEISGLSAAARSLTADLEETALIGRPAKEQGYFPVVLLFENQSDSAFLLRREGIRLETSDGRTFSASPLGEVYEELRFSQAPTALGVPFLIFPAFMIHERIEKQNNAFLTDLRDKAFRDMRLFNNPRSYNCLVFFNMTPEEALQLRASDCWLSVEVERQATAALPGEVILFRLVPEESSL